MKALSVKQPWASLIAHGIKDIENRKWKTHFRGRIYIHASGTPAKGISISSLSTDQFNSIPNEPAKMINSAIIGEVDIIDCVVNHHSIWAEKTKGNYVGDGVFVLSEKPIYNWVLANPVLYEKPILNVKGKLSFWEPTIDIVECIGCSQKFDRETMEEDDANEKYCTECWDIISPIIAQETKECKESEL